MAEVFAALQKLGIFKKIVYPGIGPEPDYDDGTKVYFVYSYLSLRHACFTALCKFYGVRFMISAQLLNWLPVKSHQTNSHQSQVTPFLVNSPYI